MATTLFHYPVSAEYSPNEITSPGLAYEDLSRIQVQTHKLATYRNETPTWALNDKMLREVIARYVEARARCFSKGTPAERLELAQRVLSAQRPQLVATIGRLSTKYVALKQCGGAQKKL